MQYPYNTCDYLLHVLLLKLVKMLAKTPPTYHWTGRPLPTLIPTIEGHPKSIHKSVFGSRKTLFSASYATPKQGKVSRVT